MDFGIKVAIAGGVITTVSFAYLLTLLVADKIYYHFKGKKK